MDKESLNNALFNNGVFPLCLCDFKNEKIVRVNGVFKEWFQQENPDFSVLTISGNKKKIFDKLHSEGIIREESVIIRHKNGHPINCLATAHLIVDHSKNELILFIIHESLTSGKETANLKKRSANLYALSENIDDLFWTVDSNLKILYFNEKFSSMAKEIFNIDIKKGDRLLDRIPVSSREKWAERYGIALQGIDKKYTDKMEEIVSEAVLTPVFNDYGEVLGVCNTIRDITERINSQKHLEVIHQRFTSILNSSADAAIIATDPRGIIRQFNKGASIMLGYSHKEVIGEYNILSFFSPPFIRSIKDLITSQTGEIINKSNLFHYLSEHPDLINKKEWSFLNKAGNSLDIKISISKVLTNGNEYTGILIIAQDISELNSVKKELETAKFQAEEVSRTKSNFLANMSHEIRTPLNGIIGMTDLLRKTEQTSVQENYSDIIQKSAGSLLLLINDILDYSKIEAGKLKLEHVSFHLRTLVNDLKNMLMINVKEREIEINIHIDNSVTNNLIGDPHRIEQILLNLVGNALKFTLKGFIRLEIYQINELDNQITLFFKIIDTGIGISDRDKEKLFLSFSQVDTTTTRKYGGTGLGLAISKELVLMMNGEIGVDSKKEKGSTFWFTIELDKDLNDENQKVIDNVNRDKLENDKVENKDQSIQILVAEDNKINQIVAMNFLKKLNYNPDLVENGEEAVRACKKKHYHMILMDQMMPVMDGIEATAEIRKLRNEKTDADVLIIALTANAMKGDRELLLDSGMDDYLSKPVLLKDVKVVLERNLKKKKLI